jgi:hypothetical protein
VGAHDVSDHGREIGGGEGTLVTDPAGRLVHGQRPPAVDEPAKQGKLLAAQERVADEYSILEMLWRFHITEEESRKKTQRGLRPQPKPVSHRLPERRGAPRRCHRLPQIFGEEAERKRHRRRTIPLPSVICANLCNLWLLLAISAFLAANMVLSVVAPDSAGVLHVPRAVCPSQ